MTAARLAAEKAPHLAIEVARRSGLPLRIAAKLEDVDRPYFERSVRPLLDGGGVEWVGEIGQADGVAAAALAVALGGHVPAARAARERVPA